MNQAFHEYVARIVSRNLLTNQTEEIRMVFYTSTVERIIELRRIHSTLKFHDRFKQN